MDLPLNFISDLGWQVIIMLTKTFPDYNVLYMINNCIHYAILVDNLAETFSYGVREELTLILLKLFYITERERMVLNSFHASCITVITK